MKTAHWFHTLRQLQKWAARLPEDVRLVEVVPNWKGGWTAVTEQRRAA